MTYGCPRVGDEAFSNYVKSVYPSLKSRLVNYHDPVPHLALTSMGYKHHNTEVYYEYFFIIKPRYESYKICNDDGEDKTCANKNIANLNVHDHVHYFDLDQLMYVP